LPSQYVHRQRRLRRRPLTFPLIDFSRTTWPISKLDRKRPWGMGI